MCNVSMRKKKATLILQSVKQTYNHIAEDFSRTRSKPAHEINYLAHEIKPGDSILDLGCGNGRLALAFQQKYQNSIHYIGVDNSEEFLKIAQKQHTNYKFKEGDLLNIPLQDKSINTIFCLRTFHHLPTNALRLAALKEMKRVLKPDGKIVLSVWHLWKKENMNLFLKAFLKTIFTLGNTHLNDLMVPWGKKQRRYYHAFTASELIRLIKKSRLHLQEHFYKSSGGNNQDLTVICQKTSPEI